MQLLYRRPEAAMGKKATSVGHAPIAIRRVAGLRTGLAVVTGFMLLRPVGARADSPSGSNTKHKLEISTAVAYVRTAANPGDPFGNGSQSPAVVLRAALGPAAFVALEAQGEYITARGGDFVGFGRLLARAPWSRVMPFVGIGAGTGIRLPTTNPDVDDPHLHYEFVAGLRVAVRRDLAVRVEYQYTRSVFHDRHGGECGLFYPSPCETDRLWNSDAVMVGLSLFVH